MRLDSIHTSLGQLARQTGVYLTNPPVVQVALTPKPETRNPKPFPPQPSTLNPQPSILNPDPQLSTLNPEP